MTMKRKNIICGLSFVIVTFLLLLSCRGETSIDDIHDESTDSIVLNDKYSVSKKETPSVSENITDRTTLTTDFKYNKADIVCVASSLSLQSGGETLILSASQSADIINKLNSLNLVEADDPYADPLTAPIGGDIILKIGDDDDKIYIVGDDVIKYGSKYYKDSDNKIKELTKTVTDLIYAYDQGR